MTLNIRDVEPMDVERLSVAMRQIDRDECRAMGHTPWQALFEAKQHSALCWTGAVNDRPEAMFGVVSGSAVTGLGHPWFLGSDIARRQQRAFLQLAPQYIERIEAVFPRLDGYVSTRNVASLRWLRYMGFKLEIDTVFNMRGEPMIRFTKGF